ncbi:hypothetical protein BOTCAL_0303g00020 [Botryotinia calthae]|uniref:Uncharacterized protein n=1 Tax=Botryotinia calthae TaxID=38488 RepID=A0A4Y8CUC3_9HELO|nr:hypothetical protein BOTCAL_0303g00020 [Botryotinia calthae]
MFVTNYAHIAALIDGYRDQAGGWQWDYWVGDIVTSSAILFAIFFFPENIFCRDTMAFATKTYERAYFQILFNFKGINHLKSGPIGVSLGISLTIGSIIGELRTGRVSDAIMYHMAQRHNGERKPEYHSYLSPLSAIFMPAGLLLFWGLLGRTGFVGPLVGLGIETYKL